MNNRPVKAVYVFDPESKSFVLEATVSSESRMCDDMVQDLLRVSAEHGRESATVVRAPSADALPESYRGNFPADKCPGAVVEQAAMVIRDEEIMRKWYQRGLASAKLWATLMLDVAGPSVWDARKPYIVIDDGYGGDWVVRVDSVQPGVADDPPGRRTVWAKGVDQDGKPIEVDMSTVPTSQLVVLADVIGSARKVLSVGLDGGREFVANDGDGTSSKVKI